MNRFLRLFEKYVVMGLLLMMVAVVGLSTVELGIMLVEEFLNPPAYLLNIDQLLKIFSFFLLILIGLELLETMKAYLDDSTVHVEVVFLVAMIAIARKVVILDATKVNALTLVGVASIILALAGGYLLVKKGQKLGREGHKPGRPE